MEIKYCSVCKKPKENIEENFRLVSRKYKTAGGMKTEYQYPNAKCRDCENKYAAQMRANRKKEKILKDKKYQHGYWKRYIRPELRNG